jgi:DNA-directed RNA polymerase specialized sigma24 family protein
MPSEKASAEFIQLLTSSQSWLFAYALSLMGDRQQAQEVMQWPPRSALHRQLRALPPT